MRQLSCYPQRHENPVGPCRKSSPRGGTYVHASAARRGRLPLSELGSRVFLEKSWVSRAVDAMVERGLVTKEPNPADARSWLVTLTAEGERTVANLDRTLDEHADKLLETLNERERAAVE